MEEKRSSGRAKRQPKVLDEGYWDCSVCTYKNSPEAYKCEMCDVRKGTSTRKPRINPQLVAQQVAQQFAPPPKKERSSGERKKEKNDQTGSNKHKGPPRLKNVDRSKASHMAVTVGNVTVIVTDYQPKADVRSSDSHISSDASDTNSSTAPHDLHMDSPSADTNNN